MLTLPMPAMAKQVTTWVSAKQVTGVLGLLHGNMIQTRSANILRNCDS